MNCNACGQTVDLLGTLEARTYHYAARALRDLHETRQALQAQHLDELALAISDAIRRVEYIAKEYAQL